MIPEGVSEWKISGRDALDVAPASLSLGGTPVDACGRLWMLRLDVHVLKGVTWRAWLLKLDVRTPEVR